MGIRNPNAANLHKQSRNRMFLERIATPVCGLARNDRLFWLPVFYLLFLSMAEIASEHRMPAAARPMIRKNVAL